MVDTRGGHSVGPEAAAQRRGSAAGDAVLRFERVSVTYRRPGHGHVVAVNDVSLDLAPGEVLGLVGESGCGKSTLARAACGLEALSSGRIVFDGRPVTTLGMRPRPSHLLGIQMVFQNPYASLNPRRRVGEQLQDALALRRVGADVTVAGLLERVDLPAAAATRFPHQFSGGPRQRSAIARALAAGPDVLIGDEPIASLDASLQARVATLMRDLAVETNTALLFISHDLGIVRLIADRIAVMNEGRIVECDAAARVWSSPGHPYTQRLLAAIPVADGLGRLPGDDSSTA